MKINRIELKNFKFHQDLNFEIINNNCLIYGENGVGKSSIYWALFSIFKKKLINIDEFKNRDMHEDDKINVKLTLNSGKFFTLNNESQFIDNNQEKIFFTHQDMLEEFLLYSENFYKILDDKIKLFFKKITNFSSSLYQFDIDTNEKNYEEQTLLRKAVTNQYEIFLNQLLIRVNNIINYHFQENFTIKFEYNWGRLDFMEYNFITPNIKLFIENESKLKLQFNEAKLKLVSIAIFFALIKLEENEVEDNSFKLLVLDDFLTSLDMANRHYIIEYIFNNFEDYQIILLTHNLQFYNLILDWINTYKKESEWDIKNIYIRNNEGEKESVIYNHNANYIEEAKMKLNGNNDELQVCGNLIRKEFERIIHELEKFYKLGKKEETDTIISLIMNDKPIYLNQNTLFKKISKDINHCKNMSNNMENNTEKVKNKLTNISEELKKYTSTSNQHLKSILENLIFYRKILLNKASHDNPNAEVYRKEYKDSIVVIEELNKLLSDLK